MKNEERKEGSSGGKRDEETGRNLMKGVRERSEKEKKKEKKKEEKRKML